MRKFTSYLVCHDHINQVRDFLKQFLEEEIGKYNHSEWITFNIPNSDMVLNLMKGDSQPLSQNFTFETSCRDMDELNALAKKYHVKVETFRVTKTEKPYTFNFIEVPGPAGICKFEANFCEY